MIVTKFTYLGPCTSRHNKLRKQHTAENLVWDQTLQESAEVWAKTLAFKQTVESSPESNRPYIGENIRKVNGPILKQSVASICRKATNFW